MLATVKGDVHDIGKNLVEIIFSNNGYQVINLGIKCPPETLIAAHKKHKPDLIGLSGLLVKSAQQMVVAAEDLHAAGIQSPMLVGGAALSKTFTHKRIAPAYGDGLVVYAPDAMKGLSLANQIMDPQGRQALQAQLSTEIQRFSSDAPKKQKTIAPTQRSPLVKIDLPIPPVPDLKRHVLPQLNLDEVWQHINPQMLYGKHLGLKGNVRRLLEKNDPKALELQTIVTQVKTLCRQGMMQAAALWCFFPAESQGNHLTLFSPAGQPLTTFHFQRQAKPQGLCLADYVLPPNHQQRDHIAMFITTAGHGIREQAEAWKTAGEYLKSHVLQALALETAEAAAEWLHFKLRAMWGFPDPADLGMHQLLLAKYRGARYSFGYPACPNLDDQHQLFQLLTPQSIQVVLTDGAMMEPEASVSALVFHHPDARYFAVTPEDD